MDFSNSFKAALNTIHRGNFESKALELFFHQSQNNQIYKNYLQYLGALPHKVNSVKEIPFLPISFFKSHRVATEDWKEEQIFQSSGTTGAATSKHYIHSLQAYLDNSRNLFESKYGPITDYHILALLPSYLERDNSSLVFMVDDFIQQSKSGFSGFYLNNFDALAIALKKVYNSERKVLLMGVTFGLLDFVEHYQFNMPKLIVMETGGMKGRRKELLRKEVHDILKSGFGTTTIHSEYGMTELLSQAYSTGEGQFEATNTMKVLVRDINDPFSYQPIGKSGGINVVDLANVDTCAFIETQDLGKLNEDGTFEVLGRFDNSDIRGCNLMVG